MGKNRYVVHNKFNKKCGYCGCKIYMDTFCMDHMEPKSKGGSNSIDNYMPSCYDCNIMKFDMSIEEFRQYLLFLPKVMVNEFRYKMYRKYHKRKITTKKTIKFYFETLGGESGATQNVLTTNNRHR